MHRKKQGFDEGGSQEVNEYANYYRVFFYFVHLGLFLCLRLVCITFIIKKTNKMKSWEQVLLWTLYRPFQINVG